MRADELQAGDILHRPGGAVLVCSVHHRQHRLFHLPKVVVVWREPGKDMWMTDRLDIPAHLQVEALRFQGPTREDWKAWKVHYTRSVGTPLANK